MASKVEYISKMDLMISAAIFLSIIFGQSAFFLGIQVLSDSYFYILHICGW